MVKNTRWLRMLAICLCALMTLGGPLGATGLSEALSGVEDSWSVSTPEHPAEPGTEAIPDCDMTYTTEEMTRDDASPGDGDVEASDRASDGDGAGEGQSEQVTALQNAASEARRAELKSEGQAPEAQPRGAQMSLSELRNKFPAGKYWNHAHAPSCDAVDYSNVWTDIPCPVNHTELIGTARQTCNGYWSGSWQTGYQCHGYAEKLGFDATGVDPETWEKKMYSGCLYELKAGDIVRYLNDRHTIFVIDVEGENVYYTDCNEGSTCVIRWDNVTTKSELAETFSYALICPSQHLVNDTYCHCSTDGSGVYACVVSSAPVYRSHAIGGEVIGYIPYDTLVYCSMGCEGLVHVDCNGISGYADPSYFARYEPLKATIMPSYSLVYLSVPGNAICTISLYLSGSLPDNYYINLSGTGAGCRVDDGYWVSATCYNFTITGVGAGDSTLYFALMDSATNNPITACEVKFRNIIERSEVSVSADQVWLDGTNDFTQIVTVSGGGYIPDAFHFEAVNISEPICEFEWVGDWHDEGSFDLKITGRREGTATLIIALVCGDCVRATAELQIVIDGTAHIEVSEPEVNLTLPDDPEHTLTFRFRGILPELLDFYATEISTPDIVMEQVGDFYLEDGVLSIDARVTGLKACSGTILFKLWDHETGDVKATLLLPVVVTKRSKPMDPPDMVLPPARMIGEEAFRGVAARVIRLPEGVMSIEARAFADCPNLRQIFLPESLVYASWNAFSGVEDLTIYGVAGSYAETFAKDEGYTFVPID